MVASPFSLILEDLLDAVRFVRGAALFDFEGETVDYAGELEPFDMKVAAATFQMVLGELRECKHLSSAYELCVGTPKAGYVLRILDDSYSLLLIVRRPGTFAVSRRVLDEIDARILDEAGLAVRRRPGWFRVEVESAERSDRPRRVRPIAPIGAGPYEPPWLEIEVLGAVVGLERRQKGYRIRLTSGAEVTLLRESRHLWFVDERLDVSNPALLVGGKSADVFRGVTPPPVLRKRPA
jgi:hypothetical protein